MEIVVGDLCGRLNSSILQQLLQKLAEELNQHKTTHDRMLRDTLDTFNAYIVAKIDGQLVGFVSSTPPGFWGYSIDKYLARENVDLSFDEGLYEMRILTVARPHRGTRLAAGLMYSAGQWAEESRGKHLVAMGRLEVLSIYVVIPIPVENGLGGTSLVSYL